MLKDIAKSQTHMIGCWNARTAFFFKSVSAAEMPVKFQSNRKTRRGLAKNCDRTSYVMEPTTVGSLWLENDLHENELEFVSHMGRSKKNVRVTSDGIHAEIHEIWTCVAPAAPPLFHAAVNPCLQGESPWNSSCNSVNFRKSTVTWMRRHMSLQ